MEPTPAAVHSHRDTSARQGLIHRAPGPILWALSLSPDLPAMQNISLELDQTTYRLEHTPSGEVRIEIDNNRVHFLPFEAALRFAFKLIMQGARTV